MAIFSYLLNAFIDRFANRAADIIAKRLEAKWSILNQFKEIEERGRSYKEQWKNAQSEEEKDAIQAKVHEYLLNMGK
jgi:hypothetical protein